MCRKEGFVMGEVVDFMNVFRARPSNAAVRVDGGIVVPFTGVRYSRHDGHDLMRDGFQGREAGGGKRRKSKSR
jgi:hypothetical protein